jgi:UDP-2,4-diacetamido-2,4,6-trideoxy-beta-L-altropyranose hydrolase
MRLLVRADASAELGTGHVVRCLALAEEWIARGGRVDFASVHLPAPLRAVLENAGVVLRAITAESGSAEDSAVTRNLAGTLDATWIVLDGYQFDAEYQDSLKREGRGLLVLDDFGHAAHYCADLVLNQNLYAREDLYPRRSPDTRLLLGSDYVLLRRQFTRGRHYRRGTLPTARHILLTLGGGDTGGALACVLESLAAAELPLAEVVVVVGPANSEFRWVEQAAQTAPWPVRILSRVDDMAGLMSWADLAVSGGGSTCWELAFMGVPNCVLSLSEHQQLVATSLEKAGAAIHLSALDEKNRTLGIAIGELARDRDRRATMSDRARSLVDGRGASVVANLLRTDTIRLREVTPADARLLWIWRNEPEVREKSFQTEPIAWSEHARWFARAAAAPRCSIWICTVRDGTPIGQGRLVLGDEGVEISVGLAPDWRGRGYGRLLIEALSDLGFREYPSAARMVAYAKPSNAASLRAFEAAGFMCEGETTVAGQPAARLVLSRAAPQSAEE